MKQQYSGEGNEIGKIGGLILLALLWIWLVYYLFTKGGIDGKNILVAAFSGIIIFVPLWKRYIRPLIERRKK